MSRSFLKQRYINSYYYPVLQLGSSKIPLSCQSQAQQKDLHRRKGKGRRCCLRQDDLKNRMDSSFFLLHIILVQFVLFLISSWCNSSFSPYHPDANQLVRQGILLIRSLKQSATTTFAFSTVYCINLKSFLYVVKSGRSRDGSDTEQ